MWPVILSVNGLIKVTASHRSYYRPLIGSDDENWGSLSISFAAGPVVVDGESSAQVRVESSTGHSSRADVVFAAH